MPAKPLDDFNLPGPETVACVSIRYQIAQKLHACTERFDAGRPNDRFRDLIDLLLLRDLLQPTDLPGVRAACTEIFRLRDRHTWPPSVSVVDGWDANYRALATSIEFPITDVHSAAEDVQRLVDDIDAASAG